MAASLPASKFWPGHPSYSRPVVQESDFWHQEHGLHPTSPLWEGVTKMMIRTLGWSALLFLVMADFGETKVNHVFFQFPNFPEFPPGKKRQISPKLQKNPGIHWTGTFQRGACKPRWKSSLCRWPRSSGYRCLDHLKENARDMHLSKVGLFFFDWMEVEQIHSEAVWKVCFQMVEWRLKWFGEACDRIHGENLRVWAPIFSR